MPSSEVTAVQIAALERNVDRLFDTKASTADLTALSDDVRDLAGEFKALRRALVGFALTIAVSAVGIAFAIVNAGGHT